MTLRMVGGPELEELRIAIGADAFLDSRLTVYGSDATEHEGLSAVPAAVVLPANTEEVATVVRWAAAHEVPLVPRGGGTGFSGGAVPVRGGVVLDTSRINRILAVEPEHWRMHVQAGVSTERVRRVARENGLFFPPDPGAAEQSHIGGNIATNAGGPHAFKYGTTGAWVSSLEAVVPPGEVLSTGGPLRKNVAPYDLRSLLVGSEGTLGIITSAWLRLIPAPEAAFPVVALYRDPAEGCAAIGAVLGSGVTPAALEYLDEGALSAARGAFPVSLQDEAGFLVIAEADGTTSEARLGAQQLESVLAESGVQTWAPQTTAEVRALWRWRDGVSYAVAAQRGGKVSEDISVPLEQLERAIRETVAIGKAHGLPTCSWGHAGDGNLHSTFMIDRAASAEVQRAHAASRELYELAIGLGGSISGEHGVGWLKRGYLEQQLGPVGIALHRGIKQLFDPQGIMNPGKKV